MNSKEATDFERDNPELLLLRSYEVPVYGVTTELFYNPSDKSYYVKGFFGAGKGDLKSFVKLDSNLEKRTQYITNISSHTLKEGGKEIIHRTDYEDKS